MSEQDIVDATAIYLDKYHNFDTSKLTIELIFEEDKGFSAEIESFIFAL
ncbi:DUF2653 family protein [Paenibacillus sp. N3.4]|nr:DUF2653 family protein [Paenibacillus sp. N3.4]